MVVVAVSSSAVRASALTPPDATDSDLKADLSSDRSRRWRSSWRTPPSGQRLDGALGPGRGHHIDPIYSLALPPNRPARSARAYVSRFNRGSSPVASVVAMYLSIRL